MSQENKPEEIDYPFPIAPDEREAPKPNYPYPSANPQPAYQPQSAYQPQATYQSPVYTPAPPPAPVVTLETYSTNMNVAPALPPLRTPTASSNTALEVTVGVITFLVLVAMIAGLVYYIWFS